LRRTGDDKEQKQVLRCAQNDKQFFGGEKNRQEQMQKQVLRSAQDDKVYLLGGVV
jgi:hypothetical protein